MFVIFATAMGCATLQEEEQPVKPTIRNPQWKVDTITNHLRALTRAREEEGRSPADRALAAQNYLIARLSEFGLQPVLGGDFRLPNKPDQQNGALTPVSQQQRGDGSLLLRPEIAKSSIAGYATGKHPGLYDELVIVCTDLGDPDPEKIGTYHRAVNIAALLELARAYGYFSTYSSLPERTVMFALWKDGAQGFRSYLKDPTWDPSQTKMIIYLGADKAAIASLRELGAPHQIPLEVVALPDETLSLYTQSVAQESSQTSLDRPELIKEAVPRVFDLASSIHNLLLLEAVTSLPFQPVSADTLHRPDAEK